MQRYVKSRLDVLQTAQNLLVILRTRLRGLPRCSMRAGPSSAGLRLGYMPIHEVAPSAVTMAVATDAMICTMNLNVSLLLMVLIFNL